MSAKFPSGGGANPFSAIRLTVCSLFVLNSGGGGGCFCFLTIPLLISLSATVTIVSVKSISVWTLFPTKFLIVHWAFCFLLPFLLLFISATVTIVSISVWTLFPICIGLSVFSYHSSITISLCYCYYSIHTLLDIVSYLYWTFCFLLPFV